jgi:hypothetical protein
MFNSHGNRGNKEGSGTVQPFEVLGKWMSRYAMWQLKMANQLFIANGGKLGPSQITYDVDQEIWQYVNPDDDESDDDEFSITSVSSGSDTESDLDDFLPEEISHCVLDVTDECEVNGYSMRKRKLVDV